MENSPGIPFEELKVRMLEQERDKSIRGLRRRNTFKEANTDTDTDSDRDEVSCGPKEEKVNKQEEEEEEKVEKEETEEEEEEEKEEDEEEEEEEEEEEDEDRQGLVGEDLQRYKALKKFFRNLQKAQATMAWANSLADL
jgi:hypothetical protein